MLSRLKMDDPEYVLRIKTYVVRKMAFINNCFYNRLSHPQFCCAKSPGEFSKTLINEKWCRQNSFLLAAILNSLIFH